MNLQNQLVLVITLVGDCRCAISVSRQVGDAVCADKPEFVALVKRIQRSAQLGARAVDAVEVDQRGSSVDDRVRYRGCAWGRRENRVLLWFEQVYSIHRQIVVDELP